VKGGWLVSLPSLNLSNDLRPLLEKYNNWLPKFKGDATISGYDHIEEFYWNIYPRMICDEDRIMMLFALSLEGQAREWYLCLPLGCIDSSVQLEDMFMK